MKQIEKTNEKMTIASTEQQKLAATLLDEQILTKDELAKAIEMFQGLLKQTMRDRETITSIEVKSLLEDAIDSTKSKRSVTFGGQEFVGFMNTIDLTRNKDEKIPRRKDLPTVDIYEDPGIWIC